jgi:multicomponent Na+:H+ antiporter subunit D
LRFVPGGAGGRAAGGRSVRNACRASGSGFEVEPLGMLFALIASGLWIVNSVYSIGYMRTNQEPRQTALLRLLRDRAWQRRWASPSPANLFTLFLFYEALTLSTYPLVTHHRDKQSMQSGRLYLVMLLGSSLLLFLPAIIITFVLAGTVDFKPGGILAGTSGGLLAVLLGLYAFGIGKAAVMPLHAGCRRRWWRRRR